METPRVELRFGSWLRAGFAIVALLEVTLHVLVFSGVLFGESRPRPTLLASQFVAGHILALGFLLSGLAALATFLCRRWPRLGLPLRAARALALPALAVAATQADLAAFALGPRLALAAVLALPAIVLLEARAPLARRHRALGAVVAIASGGAALGHPFALSSEYPGFHLIATVSAGLGLAVGLERLAAGRDLATLKRRSARLTLGGAWAAGVVLAVASVVAWPSARVVPNLLRYPGEGLYYFLAPLHQNARGTASLADVPPEQVPWFRDRSGLPPIPPTEPALAPEKPIVIFLTVDAYRAEVLFKPHGESKNLARIGQSGAVFLMARSSATATIAALTSMFSGRPYSALRWTKKADGTKLRIYPADDASAIRFPQLLQGVDRRLLASTVQLDPDLGVTGGFDSVVSREMRAPEIVDETLAWLAELGPRSGFLYSHFMDPHSPYDEAGTAGSAYVNYLGEIAIVDRELGRLYDAIRASSERDRIYLIVTSDHGEAFGEHGTTTHRYTVYEELTRVPLVIVGPGVKPRTIRQPVSLMDMGPTILDLFRVPTPGAFTGQSLVPLLRGADTPLTRPIVIDSEGGRQAMIFADDFKVLRDLGKSVVGLHDLNRDPHELDNLCDEMPDVCERRLNTLEAFVAAHQPRARLLW